MQKLLIGCLVLGVWWGFGIFSGNGGNPEAIGMFAAVPKHKYAVTEALSASYAECVRMYADGLPPFIVRILREQLVGMLETKSAVQGKVPSDSEMEAVRVNLLKRSAPQIEAAMKTLTPRQIEYLREVLRDGSVIKSATKCSWEHAAKRLRTNGLIVGEPPLVGMASSSDKSVEPAVSP